jgi:tetratricopeptide (TPR) repeat protein
MKSQLLLCAGGLLVIGAVFHAASPEKKLDPAEAARLNNLGSAYMNQQLFEKALKYFQDAAAADPNLQVAKINQGIALVGLARVDEAKKVLDEAAKADPKDPHVWYSLGMLDKNSADPQAAVEDFKQVIEIDDSDADTWYFLGTVYAQLRQFPQAIEAFERALKLNPLHASAQFGLSRALQQSGHTPEAREHLARFQYITQNHLGAAMSLAYGDQGKYSLAEESPASAFKVPPQIPVKFVDVSKEAGLETQPPSTSTGGRRIADPLLGPGACFLDYDLDGRIDLLLVRSRIEGGIALYHNLGNGKFENATKRAGINPEVDALSCTAGDYDNDGFPDLALGLADHIVLFHNQKDGTFKDVTQPAGLEQNSEPKPEASQLPNPPLAAREQALGVTFIDYDHDGDIDLYVTKKASSEQTPRGDSNEMWRNNGNGTFTLITDLGLAGNSGNIASLGTDYNNDRAVDLVVTGGKAGASIFQNQREGPFKVAEVWPDHNPPMATGVAVLDFDHDGWMDLAFTQATEPGLTLWRNNHGKSFEQVKLPETHWARAFGIAAFDYDNDGWVDLVAVGETKEGKGEVKLWRNLGPEGWKDVTADAGLDQIRLNHPRTILTGDYDNDGATDLLITQNHGPAVLLRNEGGNKNNWLRLALKGLNDNKSAIGTKVEVFSDGIRQKYEIYGSNGYLGQNAPYLTVGLGPAKHADVVRLLWPTGVLQDEVETAANQQMNVLEIDRRGSSCPTLFVWDGKHYQLVSDILGAGVVGHWVGPGERNIPRPTEWVKIDRNLIHSFTRNQGQGRRPEFSFRLIEPMEEVVYLDAVKLIAVDHPAKEEVYPNEYFASNPPYPDFKVVSTENAIPPAGAWDDKGNNLLPDLLRHNYIGHLDLLPFKGFTQPHSLILDLGEPYGGGPLDLLMHGEIEYFTATGMYAAWQAGIQPTAPYVEAEVRDKAGAQGRRRWIRVTDDMGFPAGLPKTITVDLSGKLPLRTTRIRITTNLQIYWDNILIDRSEQSQNYKLNPIPLTEATLEYHGYPRQIEGLPSGNVKYVYEQVSRTGPYARQAGEYTRYGDVLTLLQSFDDKLVVFGSGEEVALEFDPRRLPPVPKGWTRDYFFMANGYEKDMDFYAADGNTVEPLPFRKMGTYPYSGRSFPLDAEHLDYLLEYNTRFLSGNEPHGYSYAFPPSTRK